MNLAIGILLTIIGWLMAMGTGAHSERGNQKETVAGFFLSIVLITIGIYLISVQ